MKHQDRALDGHAPGYPHRHHVGHEGGVEVYEGVWGIGHRANQPLATGVIVDQAAEHHPALGQGGFELGTDHLAVVHHHQAGPLPDGYRHRLQRWR